MIVDAAMTSRTGITDLMRMPLGRFYQTWRALRAVCERRNANKK